MTFNQAVPFIEENLKFIANTGVISLADVHALYETTVILDTKERYFMMLYTDREGAKHDWFAPTKEYFDEHFVWTERPKNGFRSCKFK